MNDFGMTWTEIERMISLMNDIDRKRLINLIVCWGNKEE